MGTVVRWQFEDYYASLTQSQSYYYVGYTQTFTVPDAVYRLYISARGGWGGGNINKGQTMGGVVHGWLNVQPGDLITVKVGGPGNSYQGHVGGTGGYPDGGDGGNGKASPVQNGGYGGGGATRVFYGVESSPNLVCVAAGSGGNTGNDLIGGVGGPAGTEGADPRKGNFSGKGATVAAPGAGGVNGGSAANGSGSNGGDAPDNNYVTGAGGGGGGYKGGGAGGLSGTPAGATGSYPGGGGSNWTSGFDQTSNITNDFGFVHYGVGRSQSAVYISWHEPADSYTFDINPNDGGAATVQKNIAETQNVGPNRVNVLQEGQNQAPTLAFSGQIISQDQLEAMEQWFDRRTFIKLTDDLGREYYGIFTQWTPKRVRKATNFWYHTYDATFTISAYKNASGVWVYGRVT